MTSPEGRLHWQEEMFHALGDLTVLLKDEHTVSSYELHSSGLVQTLLNCLNNVSVMGLLLAERMVVRTLSFNNSIIKNLGKVCLL